MLPLLRSALRSRSRELEHFYYDIMDWRGIRDVFPHHVSQSPSSLPNPSAGTVPGSVRYSRRGDVNHIPHRSSAPDPRERVGTTSSSRLAPSPTHEPYDRNIVRNPTSHTPFLAGNEGDAKPDYPPAAVNMHVCSACAKQFKRPSSLRNHLNTHTGEKRKALFFPPRLFLLHY
jgi:hypothetical protein